MPRLYYVLLIIGLATATGCSTIKKLPGKMMADTMTGVVEAMYANPDPETVRQGMPTMLLLMDGMIAKDPTNRDLLQQGALAYGAYCQSFLMDEKHATRAARMFHRARGYGIRLLRTYPEIDAAFDQRQDAFEASLSTIPADRAGDLYAAGLSWLGWILANSDSMDAIADLPRAKAVMDRLADIDADYGNGVVHLFYGIFYAAQPRGAGQDLELSTKHFKRAITLAGSNALAPRVAYAEFVGKASLNEDLFTEELNAVIAADLAAAPEIRLANTLAQDRATYLLDNMDEWF
jgi:hypothetical protein